MELFGYLIPSSFGRGLGREQTIRTTTIAVIAPKSPTLASPPKEREQICGSSSKTREFYTILSIFLQKIRQSCLAWHMVLAGLNRAI